MTNFVYPIVAIVGRPNVGKSTLFNKLTKSRDAVIADFPGVTRDRIYGEGKVGAYNYILIDTGGLEGEQEGVALLTEQQAWTATNEADVILLMVDAQEGLTPSEYNIVKRLRQLTKPIFLVANKIDGVNPDIALADFYSLGLGDPIAISAKAGRGINVLMKKVEEVFKVPTAEEIPDEDPGIKITFIGRPNVGKSTLVNRLLGEERLLVYDEPGTTRDSIAIPFEHRDQKYTLIDTAGVRRRARIKEDVEKFSITKTLQSIIASDVVVLVIDAKEKISEQDLRLLGFVLRSGKALVLAINKWDALKEDERLRVYDELDRRLVFLDYVRIHHISALKGTGIKKILNSVLEAYISANKKLPTSQLTRVLQQAITMHSPPLVKNRPVHLRYAHVGELSPPTIIIHGRRCDTLPEQYKRYLAKTFRKAFDLIGTPIRIEFKSETRDSS